MYIMRLGDVRVVKEVVKEVVREVVKVGSRVSSRGGGEAGVWSMKWVRDLTIRLEKFRWRCLDTEALEWIVDGREEAGVEGYCMEEK